MQLQLAGFADEREESIADGPAGAPTLRGVTLAQEHGIAVADFNLDTPITTTKPARDESAKPVKDTPEPVETKHDGKVATVAKKAAGAVKAAAGAVADAVEHRTATPASRPTPATPRTRRYGRPSRATRTPPPRRPTRPQPVCRPAVRRRPTQRRRPESRTTCPAGDGKPAGDTARGESVVSDNTDDAGDGSTAKDNPGWTGAKHANEEKK